MSEQEAGAVVEPVEPIEPVEPVEPVEPDEADGEGGTQIEGDDADEGDGEGGEGGEDGEQEQQSQGRALTEKEIDVRGQRLDKENVRHATRVSDIMADDAPNLIPCPVCMDGIAGWVFLPEVQALPDESIARIRQVIGLPDYGNFEYATWAAQCPECKGKGKVKTYSDVPGREVTGCLRCNEAGWINLNVEQNGNAQLAPEAPAVTGPTVYGSGDPDPRIQALRDEGYFVGPPLVIQQP